MDGCQIWISTNSCVSSECEEVGWIILGPTFQKMDGADGGCHEHGA